MAEINIEKKPKIWPWILGLLVLAAIIYFAFAEGNDDDMDTDDIVTEEVIEVEEVDSTNSTDFENNAAIEKYNTVMASYSDYIGNTAKMGIDHEYSNGALVYLINAVEAKADVLDVDITADLAEARKNASNITTDPYETNHANLIKNSGKILVRAFRTLQIAKYPNLTQEVASIEKAVAAITKETHTLDQKGDVNNFYKAAEDLLIKMN